MASNDGNQFTGSEVSQAFNDLVCAPVWRANMARIRALIPTKPDTISTSNLSPALLDADRLVPGLGQRNHWSGLPALSAARATAIAASRLAGFSVAVADSSATARELANALRFFLRDSFPVLEFPDWETLPYDPFSPHEDIVEIGRASGRERV